MEGLLHRAATGKLDQAILIAVMVHCIFTAVVIYYYSSEDTMYHDSCNCMKAFTDEPWHGSWEEWQCLSYDKSCPCSYPAKPFLRLRGLCSPLIHKLFTPKLLYYPINAPLHGSHRLSAPKCPKGHQLEVGSLILMKCD